MDGWMDSGRPSRVGTGRGYATAVERITGQIISPLVGRPSTWHLGSRRTLRRGCTLFLTGIACMNPSSSTSYRVTVHQQLHVSPDTEANPPSVSPPQFTAYTLGGLDYSRVMHHQPPGSLLSRHVRRASKHVEEIYMPRRIFDATLDFSAQETLIYSHIRIPALSKLSKLQACSLVPKTIAHVQYADMCWCQANGIYLCAKKELKLKNSELACAIVSSGTPNHGNQPYPAHAAWRYAGNYVIECARRRCQIQ